MRITASPTVSEAVFRRHFSDRHRFFPTVMGSVRVGLAGSRILLIHQNVVWRARRRKIRRWAGAMIVEATPVPPRTLRNMLRRRVEGDVGIVRLPLTPDMKTPASLNLDIHGKRMAVPVERHVSVHGMIKELADTLFRHISNMLVQGLADTQMPTRDRDIHSDIPTRVGFPVKG